MQYFDTHAHIGLIHEDPIEQLIITQEARQENVAYIMSICNNLYDFNDLYNNLSSASNVVFAIGGFPVRKYRTLVPTGNRRYQKAFRWIK